MYEKKDKKDRIEKEKTKRDRAVIDKKNSNRKNKASRSDRILDALFHLIL